MIYLIYDYEEHGPTNLVATTTPANIPDALYKHFESRIHGNSIPAFWHDMYREATNSYEKLPETLTGDEEYILTSGWGGTILSVVNDF